MASIRTPLSLLLILLILILLSVPFTREAEEAPLSSAPTINAEVKCGTCPCVKPCGQPMVHVPPPSPPPPRTIYCIPSAPPPPPRFVYVTSIPGNLYTTDTGSWNYYYSGGRGRIEVSKLLMMVGMIVLSLWA